MSDPEPTNKLSREEALAAVTAPGRRFEVVDEDVIGHQMQVFRRRARSLRELVATSAAYGDIEYLVCGDLRLSFSEHYERVASLGWSLREGYGVTKGDRVAILARNSAEWILSFWAVTSLGAVVVGMNSMWSRREISDALDLCTPILIVADGERRELLGDLDIPVLDIDSDIPRLSQDIIGASLPPAAVDEDDPAVIMFTSGTTGKAKGATHSHRNIIAAGDYFSVNDAAAAEMGFGQPGRRRVLLAAPLFHMMSLHNLAVPRLVLGDTVVMLVGRFDVEKALRLIEAERVTRWGMVPTMASRLIQHGDLSRYDLSSLTAVSLGSAPSSPSLKSQLRELLPWAAGSLGTSYGLTESSSAATIATAADLSVYEDSVGTPVTTMQVEIRGADGLRAPDGSEGEVCLRGPLVMLGYWGDRGATEAAIDSDGWLRTGDIGLLLDGHLRILSRRSDLIIRGGENIYPAEVEGVLMEHPGVRECAVVGAPNEELGQEVAAVVVADDGVTQEGLVEFMGDRLARYKMPSCWYFSDRPLPRNATGKVVRHRLPFGSTPS